MGCQYRHADQREICAGRSLRRRGQHRATTQTVDRGHRNTQLLRRGHRARHDVRDVVPLEIEKDADAALGKLLDQRRAFPAKEHRADLRPAEPAEASGQGKGLAPAR